MQPDSPAPVEATAPAQRRYGLRFVDPAIEEAFRAYQVEQSVPFVRVSMVLSIGAWAVFPAVRHLFDADTAQRLVLQVYGLLIPGFVAALLASWSARRRHWLPPATMLAVFLPLASVTYNTYFAGHLVPIAASMVVIAMFGLVVTRLRSEQAIAAVVPSIVAYQSLVWLRWSEGSISTTDMVLVSYGLATLLVLAPPVVILLEYLTRQAFAAEQLIVAQQLQIQAEKAKVDALLHNVLPGPIAKRLQAGEHIADGFEGVTIVFADLVGFTPLAASLPAEEVVALLDDVFTHFDALTEQHGVEKIKTIGDAYMVASGLPEARADHAQAAARFALDLCAVMQEPQFDRLQVRVGMASGPAVAGVLGTRRLAYDLWGDAVNTASRMESHGIPGCIQLNATTRELLGDDFDLEARGTIEVKGKGALETWLLRP